MGVKRSKIAWIIPGILYGVLFFVFTGFTIAKLSSEIIGSGPDPYQYIWNADVFVEQVSNGDNPFYTDRFAYPKGVSLVMHTFTPIIGVVNLVFNNPYLSCNIALLLSFILSGIGAFLLARQFIENFWLAFLVGFVFAFSPFKTAHLLQHYHLLLTAAVPFYILVMIKAFPNGTIEWKKIPWKNVLVLLGLGIITLLGDYYTTFYLIYFSGAYFLYYFLKRKVGHWVWWKKALMVLGSFAVVHAIIEPIHLQNILSDKGAMYNAADLWSLFVPAENALIYSPFQLFDTWRADLTYKGPNEQVMFLGFGMIVFLLLALFTRYEKKNYLLLFLTAFFACLCLPKVMVFGHPVTYSPTAWLHYIPFFNNIRNPTRAVSLLYLFVPLVVAVFLESWSWLKGKEIKTMVYIVFCVLTIVEFWPSEYPTYKKSYVSYVYENLAQEEDVKVLWNIPTGIGDGFNATGNFDVKNLQRQIVHKKKLFGGYISRLDSSYQEPFKSNPVLSYVNENGKGKTKPSQKEIDHFLENYQPDVAVVSKGNKTADTLVTQLFADRIEKRERISHMYLYHFK